MDENEILMAKKKAMSLLQHNDRTEWELTDRLRQRGFCEEAVKAALEYVKSFHYIDDKRYAIRFVEIYHTSRSIQRLKTDLSKRHVPEEYISIAIEELENGDSEALQKEFNKITRGREDFSYEEKQKIAAKLYRKGFKVSDIQKYVEF